MGELIENRRFFVNGPVFDGQQVLNDVAVVVSGGTVKAIVSNDELESCGQQFGQKIDLQGRLLAPGLIDIQVNGGGGVMFNDAPTVETLRTMGAAHRRFGTTGFLPTLISADLGTMRRAIAAVAQALQEGVPGVLGIHLEGPFLNPAKHGIHDAAKFKRLDQQAFELITSLQGGRTLITIAPELTDSSMISRLRDAGIIVFGGHSAATYQQCRAALKAGMRGFTHLFNAMSAFESREPGMVGAALEDRDSWFGIIADGEHVHPASLAVAVAAKRRGYSVLVTDAMATVGSEQSEFVFDGVEISVRDGSCRTPGGQLAGSNLNMITAVQNSMRFTGQDKFEALRMASSYAAAAIGVDDHLGYIRPGYTASFIELDDQLNLSRSWINGVGSD